MPLAYAPTLARASAPPPRAQASSPARLALSLSRAAVRICDRYAPALSSGAGVVDKRDATPVTCADLAIQALVASRLRGAGAGVLVGEEDVADFDALSLEMQTVVVDLAGLDSAGAARSSLRRHAGAPADADARVWTCDPIDGSKGLIGGQSYAVGIARFPKVEGAPDIAALSLPARDVDRILLVDRGRLSIHRARISSDRCEESEGWAAEDGGLHFVGNARDTGSSRNRVGATWYFSPAKEAVRLHGLPPATPLCCGSLVKYGNVALGRAAALVQSLPSREARVWDHAAGIAGVLASGGRVTDLAGEAVIFGRDAGRDEYLYVRAPGILASAAGVDHDWFCAAARDALL